MGNNQYGEIGGVTRGVARSDRFVPWTHKAGHDGWKLVDGVDLEPIQALTAAGLDFTVEAVNLSTLIDEPMADEHTFIRGTNGEGVFGTFSDSVGLIQYFELAEWADLVKQVHPSAQVVSAYGLHRNKQGVICMELPEEARNQFGATMREFINIYSSMNGTLPMALRDSFLITECQNTLAYSFNGTKPFVQVKHTRHAQDRLPLAREAIRQALSNNTAMAELMAKLVNKRLTKREVWDFVRTIIGPRPKDEGRAQTIWDNKFDGIKAEYDAPWNKYARLTAWGALMAVNGYEQWGQAVRKAADSGEHVRQERIVEATLRGNTPLTDKALALVK
jgi:hypothetical protein